VTGIGSATLSFDGNGNLTTDENGNQLKYETALSSYDQGARATLDFLRDKPYEHRVAAKLMPLVGVRAHPDDIVVVLNPDSGRGYLSRVFNDQWMSGYGFLTECDLCVGAVLSSRGAMPQLLYVNPGDPARKAIELMRANGVSQLPVCKNEPPFAAAEVAGAVDELALMDAAFHDPTVFDTSVEKVMGPKLPTVGIGQPLARVVEMLDSAPAVLVLSGGRPLCVLTRTDVLTFLSGRGEVMNHG
jgi:cystathionine beta-synthase